MKKWIIGIIVIVIIAIGGSYIYINRSSSAVSSFKSFIENINKYSLNGAESYTSQNGDLTKLFTQIQGYDNTRQNAMKEWFKEVRVSINGTKKEDGDTVIEATVYSLNGNEIENSFQNGVNGLGITSQTIQDSNLNGNYLSAQYSNAFANAIGSNITNVIGINIEVEMKRESGNWIIQNDDEVIKAILGGVNSTEILN